MPVDLKITELIEAAFAIGADLFVLVKDVGTVPITKKITLTNLLANIPAAGFTIGADTNLYRLGADVLRTDDDLLVGGSIYASNVLAFQSDDITHKIYFGLASDTNLYRLAANRLRTDDDLVVAGAVNIDTPTQLTIATGVITVTKSYHTVETEGGAGSDDLVTINGGIDGDILVLQAASGAHTVVVKNGTGNIYCGADRTLDNDLDTITLIFSNTLWRQISFSDNAG